MKSSTGLDENIAGALCYLFGLITGIIFFILEKDSEFVKFHAMQSIIAFGTLWIANWVVALFFMFVPFIDVFLVSLIKILTFIVWIVCMIKAYQGDRFKLPIIGEIAEEQAKRIKI
ncbi:MAG: hypothetical protein DSY33_04725 [Archaeoglobus sp.]|jgi:uncharacterized membrane protein|nr:MAG: hypothetical protein DSY33_04725 [Archaeoglobus sp.]